MKDVFCVTAFIGKLLCPMVFLSALRPDNIVAVRASMEPAYCKTEHSRMQGCGLNALAAVSSADVGPCSNRSSVAHC